MVERGKLALVLGGLATALAGVVSDIWGPVTGGLFLAFGRSFARVPRSLKNMSASAKTNSS